MGEERRGEEGRGTLRTLTFTGFHESLSFPLLCCIRATCSTCRSQSTSAGTRAACHTTHDMIEAVHTHHLNYVSRRLEWSDDCGPKDKAKTDVSRSVQVARARGHSEQGGLRCSGTLGTVRHWAAPSNIGDELIQELCGARVRK